MVKVVNNQMEKVYKQYLKSERYNLCDAYGRYSYNKIKAFKYCKSLMSEYGGSGLKLISFNTNMFTAGFICDIDGVKSFVYITKSYDRYCNIDRLN